MTKKSVLFLCTGNSARSQIAEALLKFHASNDFDVYSAGAKPETVHPLTYQVLNKFGVKEGSLRAKHVDEFASHTFDYVITLCEHASAECKSVPYKGKRLEWNFSDPKAANQSSYEAEPFETCVHEINRRIVSFVAVESPSSISPSNQEETRNHDTFAIVLSPTQLFKSLSDELRLKCLMLVQYEGELCVCELQEALDDIQPKVSRHLALLRKQGLLTDRRAGHWVFYRINPSLPNWAKSILSETTDSNIELIRNNLSRLNSMGERPSRTTHCCS